MNEADVYIAIRYEIVTNHVLMHLFGLAVAVILLFGAYIAERRETIIAVLLPILTLGWAAATVRFDYFIHRQGAYLRAFETEVGQAMRAPLWETWKGATMSASVLVPFLDVFVVLSILIPTFYVLFGPSRQYFKSKGLNGGRLYAWCMSIVIVGLVLSLGLVPFAFD